MKILNLHRVLKNSVERRGYGELEVVVSCVILAALITVTGQLIVRSHRIERETRSKYLALQDVANRLETCLNDGPESISQLEAVPPSAQVLHQWPQAKYQFELGQDAMGERVTISLRLAPDPESVPISLAGWFPADAESDSGDRADGVVE